jgi:MFS family permease
MRNPPNPAAMTVEQHDQSSLRPVVVALRERKALLLLAVAMVMDVACQNGIMAFMSAFLMRVHQLPIDRAGLAVGIVLGAGAGVGMPLGGVLTDIFTRHWPAKSFYRVAALMVAGVPFALAGLIVPATGLAIRWLIVFELFCSCGYTAALRVYLNAAPQGMRGALSAFATILVTFVGSGLGPPLAGLFSDLLNGAGVDSPLRWALSLTTSLLVVSNLLTVIAGWFKPAPVPLILE